MHTRTKPLQISRGSTNLFRQDMYAPAVTSCTLHIWQTRARLMCLKEAIRLLRSNYLCTRNAACPDQGHLIMYDICLSASIREPSSQSIPFRLAEPQFFRRTHIDTESLRIRHLLLYRRCLVFSQGRSSRILLVTFFRGVPPAQTEQCAVKKMICLVACCNSVMQQQSPNLTTKIRASQQSHSARNRARVPW